MRTQGARNCHEARRVLVQPMHDAGAGDFREPCVVMQQRVLQRPGGLAGAGMDDQAHRFVDYQDIGVLVADIQGDVFRRQRYFLAWLRIQADQFVAAQRMPRQHRLAIEQHVAGFDPGREPRA